MFESNLSSISLSTILFFIKSGCFEIPPLAVGWDESRRTHISELLLGAPGAMGVQVSESASRFRHKTLVAAMSNIVRFSWLNPRLDNVSRLACLFGALMSKMLLKITLSKMGDRLSNFCRHLGSDRSLTFFRIIF